MYFCKVIIADDLEGRNEGHVELLVLGIGLHLRSPRWIYAAHFEADHDRFTTAFYVCVFVCLHIKLSEVSAYGLVKAFCLPAFQSVHTAASMATA